MLHHALTEKIIGVFYDVYNELGHGFLESVYETAMVIALEEKGLKVERQVEVPVWFRGQQIGTFYADLLVEGLVIVELKAVRSIDPSHEAQLLHYLRATEIEIGLLLNFGVKPEIRVIGGKVFFMTGRLIIISSPSGGGKGTLIKEVRAMMPDLGFSVSHTTRPQRFGEEDGREYFFIKKEEFKQRIEDGDFLEYAEVHGNLYGTSIAESGKADSTGKDLIVEIDVQGAVQIMEKLSDSLISIFILPPSFEVLRARLTSRGTEGEAELNTRLRNAFNEVLQYSKFKYVIINQDVSTASRQIVSIITAERQMLDRQSDAIQGILNSFDAWKHRFEGE